MWFWIFGQIFLGLAYNAVADVPPCPPRENVLPCSCDSDGFLTSVGCRGINGLEKLYPVLKNTRGLNMSYAFWKSNLGDIPSDFFEGQGAVNLHFEDCKISSFGDRPFTGLEDTLKKLYIWNSVNKKRHDLKQFPIGHLRKLEELVFESNDIVRLGNDWFRGGPAPLRTLLLEANDIEELGDQAFASLVNLQQIWLGDNRSRKVSRSMFPRPANKLQILEISFNGIEELPQDFFEDMPALTTANLAGNKLVSLPESTWGKIWNQLDEVYLERNYGFQCDERIKWIYEKKLPRMLRGECKNEKMYGKKLHELTLADFE